MTGQSDPNAQPTAPNANENFSELRQAVADVGQLGVNVRAGKVRVDPAVGSALLVAMRAHAEEIAQWQWRAGELARPLPLGDNPVGTSMGVKFASRAQGHDTALGTVLAQYRDAVVDAGAAIEQAMQRYAGNEHAIHDSFRRISAT